MTAATCGVCGGSDLLTRWHVGRYAPLHRQWVTSYCGFYDETTKPDEHLHFYCVTCIHDWCGEVALSADSFGLVCAKCSAHAATTRFVGTGSRVVPGEGMRHIDFWRCGVCNYGWSA